MTALVAKASAGTFDQATAEVLLETGTYDVPGGSALPVINRSQRRLFVTFVIAQAVVMTVPPTGSAGAVQAIGFYLSTTPGSRPCATFSATRSSTVSLGIQLRVSSSGRASSTRSISTRSSYGGTAT